MTQPPLPGPTSRPPDYALYAPGPWDGPLAPDQPTELLAPIRLEAIERRSLRERLAEHAPASDEEEVLTPNWRAVFEEPGGQANPPDQTTSLTKPDGAAPTPETAAQDQDAIKPTSVLGSTLAMASGTLVSRLLGLVRVALLAAVIGGLSRAGNAFDVANNLPNFIYAILAGGVLNAVLVPQIVRAFADGRGAEYVYRLLTLGTVILGLLTLALTLGAAALVWAFTFSKQWPADQMALAITFAAWCIPQVFFYGLYTLWGQVLNARGSFAPVMWAPVVNNVVSIIGFGAFGAVFGKTESAGGWSGQMIALLAGTATLGVILQALVLLIPLQRLGLRPKWRFSFRGYGLTRVGQMTGWTTLALLVDQAAMWVAVLTATAAPQAAGDDLVAGNMALTNALATYIIPHSLITVSLTTALFTRMSKAAQAYDLTAVREDLSYGIRTTSVFSFFFTAVMVVLAQPIIRVIFAGSGPAVIRAYASVLIPLALGLVPLGITLLVRRVFFALDDGRTVFWLQVPMSAVWVGFILLCRAWLDPAWWVVGIALGQTLSFVAGAVLRLVSLQARLRGIDGRRLAWLHLRAAVAALLTGELGYLLTKVMAFGDLTESVSAALVTLVVVGPVMAVAYVMLLKVMRVKELSEFLSPALDRLRGRRTKPPVT